MKLGILTGGSDCQGINGALRAIVKAARSQYNWDTIGFLQGYKGLLENRHVPLEAIDVSGILPSGGTILGTSPLNPNKIEGAREKILQNVRESAIDALIAIGGVDTLKTALDLFKAGINMVGIPATVDNDVARTDLTIGFQSAVSVVTEAVDRLHTTASAHHRVMIVEVMGRSTGWVALYGGLAGGADWIIIPEVQVHFNEIISHIKKRRSQGKRFSIIVVAEGSTLPQVPLADVRETDEFGRIRMDKRNIGTLIGREIEKVTGLETRITVLGHLQRGGPPVCQDRILATRMGIESVEMVKSKKFGRMVTFCNNGYSSEDLSKVIKESPRMVPIQLYSTAGIFY